MSHARIEEVSDSDPEIDDPSDYLPDNDAAIIRRANAPAAAPPSTTTTTTTNPNPTLFRPPPPPTDTVSRESIKSYCTIYPCYFSSSRTRSQGRRVPKHLAIANPLAYNLLPALRHVCSSNPSIKIAFEPDKTHPKDWSNPGRLRIQLFDPDTHKSLLRDVPNKERLFDLMGEWLQSHPTQPEDALAMKIPGLSVPEGFVGAEIKKPRGKGWETMNEVLPLHSCAVSGGGVKDDFFKEAMEEMRQMQANQGGGVMPGGMDMGALQQMMQGMGGMLGGGGGGSGRESSVAGGLAKKKKGKK